MKKIISIVCALFVMSSAIFAAKAKKTPVPGWLTQPTSVYPSSQYFSGVGSGDDRDKAGLEAVKIVAGVFGQDISSTTNASKRMEQAKQEGKVVTTSTSTLSDAITSKVNQDNLIGIEIPEYYFEEKTGKWYAVAILDKPKVAKTYVSMITKNNETIDALKDDADMQGPSFAAYSDISFAIDIAKINDSLVERLAIINAEQGEEMAAAATNAKILKTKLTEIARDIPICLKISGDKNGRLEAAFGKCFAKFGFKTTKDESSRYSVKGAFTFDTSNDGNMFTTYYSLESSLNDSFEGQDLFPVNFQGREKSPKEADVNNRAFLRIEKNVATQFEKTLNEYLNSVKAN